MTKATAARAGRTVLDCRWLGAGGPGRCTELVLRGLGQLPAPPPWVLWGPARTRSLAWPAAEVVVSADDPRRLRGQRDTLRIPPGDLVVFMHQQRPLRAARSVTLIYDTTSLRHGATPLTRRVKALFLKRVSRASERIATVSAYSSRCIQRDLGVPPERISVLPMPRDDDLARRVAALRQSTPMADVALYAGNFLPHKNLGRLIAAFAATEFRQAGGRLLLVGGSAEDVRTLAATLPPSARDQVDVRRACPQDELDLLYATSRFLVLPSLEEGFGLPAWEALSCGVPVAVSTAGALPEVVGDRGERFDPTSVTDMTQALDRCAMRARHLAPSARDAASIEFRRGAPTLRDLGDAFLDLVAAARGTSQAPEAGGLPSMADGDPA